MYLERGIRALEGDMLAGQLERLIAGDPDLTRTPAEPAQAAVQGAIASRVGHHANVKMRLAEGGQDADQRYPAPVRPGRVADSGQELTELTGERGERASGQHGRRGVQLQVEPVQLEGDPGIGG